MIDPGERPAAGVQARAEIEFLAAVQVAVGQMADRFDRRASVDAAAIEPGDRAGATIRIMPLGSLLEFEVRDFAIDDEAADARNTRILLQELDRGRYKLAVQPHIAIDQAEMAAAAVLKPELCADAPGAVRAVVQLHDLDRISSRNLDCPVG